MGLRLFNEMTKLEEHSTLEGTLSLAVRTALAAPTAPAVSAALGGGGGGGGGSGGGLVALLEPWGWKMHTFEGWRSRHGRVVTEDRRVRSAAPLTMPLTAARVAVLSELLRQWTTSAEVSGGAASPPPTGPEPAVRLSLEAPELHVLLFAAAPPAPPPPPQATGRAAAATTPAAAAAAATEVERQQALSPGKVAGGGAGGEAEALLLRLAVSAPRLELASAELATLEVAGSRRDRGRLHRGAARARALHVFNEHPAAAYPELLGPAEELLPADVPAGDGAVPDDGDGEAAGLLRLDCRARQDQRGVVVEEATLLLGGVSLRLDLKSAKALVAALAQVPAQRPCPPRPARPTPLSTLVHPCHLHTPPHTRTAFGAAPCAGPRGRSLRGPAAAAATAERRRRRAPAARGAERLAAARAPHAELGRAAAAPVAARLQQGRRRAPESKASAMRPARAARDADSPRLAGASGSLRRGLAPKAASGEPAG